MVTLHFRVSLLHFRVSLYCRTTQAIEPTTPPEGRPTTSHLDHQKAIGDGEGQEEVGVPCSTPASEQNTDGRRNGEMAAVLAADLLFKQVCWEPLAGF